MTQGFASSREPSAGPMSGALSSRDFGTSFHPIPTLEYVRQGPDDLVYRLLDSPAPRGSVKVLVERRIRFGVAEAVLAIIGSSHFLEIGAGDRVLTEMLASTGPSAGALPVECTLRGCEGSHGLERDGVSYQFQMSSRRYGVAGFERESRRLSEEASDRISYRFPVRAGELAAVTCLEWHVAGRRLVVETYHTFPGESTVVWSRTRVEVPERRVAA